MILTLEILNKGMSRSGGMNSKQLTVLGLRRQSLKKGWAKLLVGQDFPPETVELFLNLKGDGTRPIDSGIVSQSLRKQWTSENGNWYLTLKPNGLNEELAKLEFDFVLDKIDIESPDEVQEQFIHDITK